MPLESSRLARRKEGHDLDTWRVGCSRSLCKRRSTLANILNAIVEAGGTTAMEEPLNAVEFAEQFLRGPDVLPCVAAVDPASGELLGFQALRRYAELPEAGPTPPPSLG
jgi:hypothetical protein